MTLPAGTRLGPYEILAPLGAGGMGEVYRAKDTRLAREVAIKVLPDSLASDVERLRRFEKEAKSASALNHPNIVTIHDIGSESGVSYIAMELVDGTTLRELLASGPLPIKKLLQIAPQIAVGLAKAHEAGIVHRDLKPENVMVKRDGLVKILDFGLAKLSSTGSGSDEASQLPTMTGTQPGVVVGTVSYMSPEQAGGQVVDFRSDQFALGSMLYEMATGRRAFQRKTAVDTLAAILNEEPEPIAIAASQVPAPLRWTVERCLTKDAQGRYASTEDLSRDLSTLRDHLSESISSGALVAATGGGARRRFTLPLVGLIAAAATLIGVGLLADRWLTSRHGSPHVPTFRQLTFRRGNIHSARFTQDGRTVVYGASWDGAPGELFTVRTDSTDSHPLGISRAEVLSVSSKGELAVLLKKNTTAYGVGTLARVPIGGGSPREILEDVWDADWAPNGEDLAVIRRAPNGGAEIQYPIGTTLVEGGDIAIGGGVRVSPKGDLVVYVEGQGGAGTIKTVDRKGRRRSISEGWREVPQLLWSPLGDELILTGGRSPNERAAYAVSLSGHVRVLVNLAQGLNLYDVAADGRLLVEAFSVIGSIACQPRGENRERDIGLQDSFVTDISEDGQLVLFQDSSEPGGILLRKSDGTPPVHLGHGDAQGLSADGRWVLAIVAGPPPELVLMPTGPGAPQKLPVEGVEPRWAAILPNGKGFLVGAKGKGESAVDFFIVGPDGGKPTPVRADGSLLDRAPVVSPKGDRLAYVVKDLHIRVVPILGGGAVAIPGSPIEQADVPVQWSADGQFLFVYSPGGGGYPARIDKLEIATGTREPWKKLMPSDPTGVDLLFNVSISRDGQSYAYCYQRVLTSNLFVVEGIN